MRSPIAIEYQIRALVEGSAESIHGLPLCVHSVSPHYVHGHLSVDVEVGVSPFCPGCSDMDVQKTETTPKSLDDMYRVVGLLKKDIEEKIEDIESANIILRLTPP
jgi:hypothetical protein